MSSERPSETKRMRKTASSDNPTSVCHGSVRTVPGSPISVPVSGSMPVPKKLGSASGRGLETHMSLATHSPLSPSLPNKNKQVSRESEQNLSIQDSVSAPFANARNILINGGTFNYILPANTMIPVPQKPNSSSLFVGRNSDQQPDADSDTKSSNIGSVGTMRGAHPFAELPPHLFALIIGINKYESPSIPYLLGAVPDADAMQDYLQEHLGVPSSQIRNLRDSEATRAAILEEIMAFSFNNKLEKGDPILIYYAGHGGSADTPRGWEVGSTGKIELLIPYDHSSPLEDGNLKYGIPDRTLEALFSQLASKKGDNITVILDCCRSGSDTRNILDPTIKTRGFDVENVPSNLDQDIWGDVKRLSGIHSGFARKGLRSHVLLGACSSQEFAYERTSRGVFTKALLSTLMDNGIDKLTYTALFDLMPSLSSEQNPQCEGFFRDRLIFNGKASGRRKSKGETYNPERYTAVAPALPDVDLFNIQRQIDDLKQNTDERIYKLEQENHRKDKTIVELKQKIVKLEQKNNGSCCHQSSAEQLRSLILKGIASLEEEVKGFKAISG